MRWTVRLQRGDRFPGWGWIDRIDSATSGWNDDIGILVVIMGTLNALTVPSRLARRLAYRRQGRCDWDVLVYRGWAGIQHQRDAVHRERCDDLDAAALRGGVDLVITHERRPRDASGAVTPRFHL
ncbi:hypothetical protein D1825_14255 [Cellulomonas rhizosphaerae]|uniref:Uncharacterized protein n=1 Tax=Cellulomonas rhizosphaerae TaxID=2293719 RepID=A0A413RJ22_9CELL|nr:hypothetical protein D1825_14255 [Cellulomonas rhizosphaerae]